MPIRKVTSADIPSVVSVLTTAFWDEVGIGHYFHPRRNEFPIDMKEFWQRTIRQEWWDWQNSLLVAVNEKGEIVGVADWTRMGNSAQAKVLGKWDPRRLLRYFVFFYNRFLSLMWPNRAADLNHMNAYRRAVPFFRHHWTGSRSENFTLKTLGVLPEYQGKGYGKELVKWGLERAMDEGVAAGVISSYSNERFYRKCGFNVKVGKLIEGEGNPLSEFADGVILFKDPTPSAHTKDSE